MRTAPTLTLTLLAAWVVPAAAQPLLVLPDNREGWPWGTCIHTAAQQDGPATQALDALGAPWVRIDVNWNEVEPQQGVFSWDEADRMIDTARAHGLLVYATLAYTPQWATAGPVRMGVPLSADYYRDFVTAAVTRYQDRVKHWGMWNEPEQQGRFWVGTAQEYVDYVLRPGAEAVHAADPAALVLGPDSGDDAWLTTSSRPAAGPTSTSSRCTCTRAATRATASPRCCGGSTAPAGSPGTRAGAR